MKKKKNYIRPAVALAACAALVIGIGFGNLPERILSNAVMSHKTVAPIKKPSQNMENGFVMKVRAAEVKELEKGKAPASWKLPYHQGDQLSQRKNFGVVKNTAIHVKQLKQK